MENLIKTDDLGGKPTIFGNTHICIYIYTYIYMYMYNDPPVDGGNFGEGRTLRDLFCWSLPDLLEIVTAFNSCF